jgi:anti-sigma28 factor (negative regulator of flagellin synthesis)
MAIVEITGGAQPVDPLKGGKGETAPRSKSPPREGKDRVEVSDEARALYDAEQTKRFEAIREKISQGFYFQPEVTERIVDALLKELKDSSPST